MLVGHQQTFSAEFQALKYTLVFCKIQWNLNYIDLPNRKWNDKKNQLNYIYSIYYYIYLLKQLLLLTKKKEFTFYLFIIFLI